MAVAITGTRDTRHREDIWYSALFRVYLAPWATQDARFYIGGAKGIDSLALCHLAEESHSRITVVVPGTVEQQPAEAQHTIEQCRRRDRIAEIVALRAPELRTAAFHARNRWMVDRADMVIGFPLTESAEGSGTWQTLNYAAELGKPRLIVPV
ncbi:DNA-processing protein DprA [Streptomyces youssoufiensis]